MEEGRGLIFVFTTADVTYDAILPGIIVRGWWDFVKDGSRLGSPRQGQFMKEASLWNERELGAYCAIN